MAITVPEVDVRDLATDGADVVWLEGWNHLAPASTRIERPTARSDARRPPRRATQPGSDQRRASDDVAGGLAAHGIADFEAGRGTGARSEWVRPETEDGAVRSSH